MKISFAGLDDSPKKTLTEDSQTALIGLLRTIPHGVLKYSHDVEGLVETSNNLAAVKCDGGKYNVVSSTRSSIAEALELPPIKLHCSVLAEDSIKKAIENWESKQ